ncbi:sigma factor-like helix-turn-helix DNA-binding protein [Bacillus sp. PS06]|uniref:sigma factor-like helix-turn-helix DNA-binding protein n=1 Tax=Bacillus sp. PS06 TaxID=2764176 RepID=UPI00178639C6|nr:sigma factor-like helix-turn-helix DNA-binding protein [Bacillus sp. PS06]MBD8067797.1 hypothetical protein [Bacillus sp. PS06]
MISREDALYYVEMLGNERIHKTKRYYKLLNDRESFDYKRIINVYLEHKNYLSEREKFVLVSIYGVKEKPMKLREVGAMLELTPERIRELIQKGERRITTILLSKYKIDKKCINNTKIIKDR